ncbi:MAG: IS630 family transposase [Myxococcaceae bacterium]
MSRAERIRLRRIARSTGERYALVQRARAVLALRLGHSLADVASQLGMSVRWVCKWRLRWMASPCADALLDAERPGRPPTVSAAAKCELMKLACDRPPKSEFSAVWTQQALADALCRQTGTQVSRSTVQRILSAEGLRPHRVRQWLHSPDPAFREKVERVCKLYLRPPTGSTVICIDEKPMQAVARKHPTTRQSDGVVRKEFEYIRHGTCCLLAGLDVKTGEVLGRVVKHRTAPALVDFLEEVARRYPHGRVYVVWDNLNIHADGKDARWTKFNRRHGGRFHFVHTPLHASWVNQIEVWFSILQRRVLRHGSFSGWTSLRSAVLGFIAHWNRAEAHPFRWTFAGRFDEPSSAAAA